jgi:hypothetical protein
LVHLAMTITGQLIYLAMHSKDKVGTSCNDYNWSTNLLSYAFKGQGWYILQ